MANIIGKDNYELMPQITGIDIVPSGGTTGQVLTKVDGTSYNYTWQQAGVSDHTLLSNIGTNSHAAIDSHIANVNIHANHSTITFTAGSGMTGGGTIAASRTLNVIGANSIVANADDIQLVNDLSAPGNSKVYGTTAAGVKGWKNDPAGGASVDRQVASSTTVTSTTSTTYGDLSSMTVTTKNLGGTGTYVISFSCEAANQSRGASTTFILNIGGSDVAAARAERTPGQAADGATDYATASVTWLATGVTSSTVIKVRWKVDSSTGYSASRRLVIDGVLSSTVI